MARHRIPVNYRRTLCEWLRVRVFHRPRYRRGGVS